MKLKGLVFVCLIAFNSIFSQLITPVYVPKNRDSIDRYINTISEKKLQKLSKLTSKDVKKIIAERKKYFFDELNDSAFVFNPELKKYLNSVLKEIYKSNPSINKSDFYFFIDKSPIPNAACYGNGIFTVNLGLFEIIHSDDELAFVLAHEIAHYMLEHNDKSLLKYLETLNSKETKNEIRKIKKQDYGQGRAAMAYMEKMQYNFQRRSRKAELEADSLGYVLFANTKYAKKASIDALARLGTSDSLLFKEPSNIRKHLNFTEYPFKEVWLKKDDNLFDIKESANDYAFNKDSIKTHPDIPYRISVLKKNGGVVEQVAPISKRLQEVKNQVARLIIADCLEEKRLDFAMYKIMVMYNRAEIKDDLFNELMAKLLVDVYKHKVNHSLGKYVSPVNPFSDELFINEIKLFLQNTEAKNLKKIGYHFCQERKTAMKGNTDFQQSAEFFTNIYTKTN